MNYLSLIPKTIEDKRLLTDEASHFSKTKLRKALMAENPHLSKKEVCEMLNEQMDQVQPQVAALLDAARSRGYSFDSVRTNKSGGIYFGLKPAPKTVRKATLSKASNDDLLAELAKRGLLPQG